MLRLYEGHLSGTLKPGFARIRHATNVGVLLKRPIEAFRLQFVVGSIAGMSKGTLSLNLVLKSAGSCEILQGFDA